MSIIITERMKTIMKRWLTIQYPKCVSLLTELQVEKDEDKFCDLYHQDNMSQMIIHTIKVEIELYKNWNHTIDDEIYWDEIELSFNIVFNNYSHVHVYGKSIDELFTIIDNLTEFKSCSSCDKEPAEKDGFCSTCYPWVTTQEENCCICLENPLQVWIKLSCNHILHERCYVKMIGFKCPLCRADTREDYHSRQRI
jgi:hypothetical protein